MAIPRVVAEGSAAPSGTSVQVLSSLYVPEEAGRLVLLPFALRYGNGAAHPPTISSSAPVGDCIDDVELVAATSVSTDAGSCLSVGLWKAVSTDTPDLISKTSTVHSSSTSSFPRIGWLGATEIIGVSYPPAQIIPSNGGDPDDPTNYYVMDPSAGGLNRGHGTAFNVPAHAPGNIHYVFGAIEDNATPKAPVPGSNWTDLVSRTVTGSPLEITTMWAKDWHTVQWSADDDSDTKPITIAIEVGDLVPQHPGSVGALPAYDL